MMRYVIKLFLQISLLSLFFLIGSSIQHYLNLIVPGSVIGLLLLFLCLFFNILPESWVRLGANFMTRHLIIFFVPATVAIINYYELFIGKGIFLVLIAIVSSLIVLVIAGYVSEKLAKRREGTEHG